MTMSALGNEQEKRTAKAILEGPEMIFTKSPLGYVVTTPSGGCYQVSAKGCSCPDYQQRCAGVELNCKHQVALAIHLLTVEGPAPRAATKEEREDAAFMRLYGG